ncbi:MAG: hypothetical protein ACJA2S_005625, partial [Cyclobacteriaceae bacterium]
EVLICPQKRCWLYRLRYEESKRVQEIIQC